MEGWLCKSPSESTKKLFKLISSARIKNTGSIFKNCYTNIMLCQLYAKNQLYIYTVAWVNIKWIKKTIPFTRVSQRIQYLGINFNKCKTYTENDKVLLKEIIEDLNKWEKKATFIDLKTKYCSDGELIYRFNAIAIKIPGIFS